MTATLSYGSRWQFLRSSKHCLSICSLQHVFPVKWKLIPLFVYFEDWLQSRISVRSHRIHCNTAAQKAPSQHNPLLGVGINTSHQIWTQRSKVSAWTDLSIMAACPCKLIPNAFLLLIAILHLLPQPLFHTFFLLYNFGVESWGGTDFELVSWFLWDYNSLIGRRKCFIHREGTELELLLRSHEDKNLFEETNWVVPSSKAFSVKGEKQLMSFSKRFLLFSAKETVTVGHAITFLSAVRLISLHLSYTLFSSTVPNWNFYPCVLWGKETFLPFEHSSLIFKITILLRSFSSYSCS